MSDFFTSTEQLRDAFCLEKYPDYVEFTPFTNGIGFSVQKAYPKTSKYSPPVTKDGTPDTYALFGIKYGPVQLNSKDQHRVPIFVKVSVFSRYLSNHMDYNFSDEKCPTEESVLASKRTSRPIDLSSSDEYFFDHEQDSFVNRTGNKIEGINIINDLYALHLATVDKFKGLVLRWKMISVYRGASLCRPISYLLKWILKTICGRTFEPNDPFRGILQEYRQEDLKLLKTERIDVFGYKASKNVIVTFCILLLTGYLTFNYFGYSPEWLKGIMKNTLLSFAFAVISISILDYLLPGVLFYLVNLMIRVEFRLTMKQFKFK